MLGKTKTIIKESGMEAKGAFAEIPVAMGTIYDTIAQRIGELGVEYDDLCVKFGVDDAFFDSLRIDSVVTNTTALIKILEYLGINENDISYENRPFWVLNKDGQITRVGYKEFREGIKWQLPDQ